ncbi:hypothetical protein, partial [Arsukibacterium sp.]|uniref:hypothetical protein n=1 Tax=Arsukibacterium sp. TaxID=1977258 RepID=UPI00299E39A1
MLKRLVWFTLILTIMLVSPAGAQSLPGKWRGKLVLAPQAVLTIGININHSAKGYSLTLDSPNQGMFDYQPSQFIIDGNHVQFQDDKLNASFSGTLVK